MRVVETYFDAIKVIELAKHEDERGFFMEIYNKESFNKIGIFNEFVQDNCSSTLKKGVLRGLHYQKEPFAQSKLIRCTKGKIVDISVDLRKNSPTYGQSVLIELSGNQNRLVLIPKGFAHGVLVVEDDSEYNYKVDNVFNKDYDRGLDYNCLNIDYSKYFNGDIYVSQRDKNNPILCDIDNNFEY